MEYWACQGCEERGSLESGTGMTCEPSTAEPEGLWDHPEEKQYLRVRGFGETESGLLSRSNIVRKVGRAV